MLVAVTMAAWVRRCCLALAWLRVPIGAAGLLVAVVWALQMALAQAQGAQPGVQWLGEGDAPTGLRLRLSADAVPFGASAAGNFSKAPPVLVQCSVQGPARPDRVDLSVNNAEVSSAHWVNAREWVWDFGTALRGGQHCTVGVNPAFRTVAGAPLPATVVGRDNTLHIPGPRVVETWPREYEHIDEAQLFLLRLNAPVSRQTVLEHASCRTSDVGEAAAVRWVEGRERDRLIAAQDIDPRSAQARGLVALACERRLNSGAKFTLVWGGGMHSEGADAARLGKAQHLQWQVREAFVARLHCQRERARADCLPIAPVELRFSAPVPQKLAAQIRLVSMTEGAKADAALSPTLLDMEGEPIDDEVLAQRTQRQGKNPKSPALSVGGVRFATPLQAQASYRVELPQGFVDDAGRVLVNARAWPLPVRTGALPVLARFASDEFGVIERATSNPSDQDAPALLPITVRNIEPMLQDSAAAADVPAPRIRDLHVADDAEIIAWWHRLDDFRGEAISRKQARHHLGDEVPARAPKRTKKADDEDDESDHYVDARSLSLLRRQERAQLLTLPKGASGERPQRDFEVLGVPLSEPGFHVVELESPALGERLLAGRGQDGGGRSMFVRTAALVTDLSVHLKTSHHGALVWVTRLSTGEPVKGARVQVSSCSGDVAASGETDAQGTWAIDSLSRAGPGCNSRFSGEWFVSARTHGLLGGVTDMAFVWSSWDDGIEPWRFDLPRIGRFEDSAEQWHAHSVLDRTLLRGGDVVSMKHYVRIQDVDGLRLPPAWPRWVSITHVGSDQRFVQPLQWLQTKGGARNADSRFELPKRARLGEYKVALHFCHPEGADDGGCPHDDERLPEELSSAHFKVAAFRTPVFRGEIALDAQLLETAASGGIVIAPKNTDKNAATWALPLSAQLHYFNGGAARGQRVQISAVVKDEEPPHFAQWPAFDFRPHAGNLGLNGTLSSSGSGAEDAAELDWELQNLGRNAGWGMDLGGEWGDEAHSPATRVVADKIAAVLDDSGHTRVQLQDLPTPRVPTRLTAQMTFSDPNGEIQTLQTQRTLWPAAAVVGVDVGSGVVGQRLPLTMLAVDAAARVQPGLQVSARAQLVRTITTRHRLVGGFYSYHNERYVEDLGAVCSGKTDERGQLSCGFTPKAAGALEIVATVTDAAGRQSHSATSAWVSAPGQPQWFGGQDHDRIDLIAQPPKGSAEGAPWRVGDTARIQVQMPFQRATALVTVEREGILHREVVQLHADDPTVSLRIQPNWGRNVFVSVLLVRPRVFDVPWYSFFTWGLKTPKLWWDAFWGDSDAYAPPGAMVDLSKPAMRLGVTQLAIEDASHTLKLTMRAEQTTLAPRETARVHIQAHRADGSPAAGASVAIAAVDDALLALMPNATWDLERALLRPGRWGVDTATAQMHVVGRRHFGLKAAAPGGGGGGDGASARELLDTLLLWQPHVTLDEQGRATVDVPMNDVLSSFTVAAFADDGVSRFGRADVKLRTTQDIQLLSALPPIAREGDAFAASVMVRNTTDAQQRLRLSAMMGDRHLPDQDITLLAQSSAVVEWPVTIPTVAEAQKMPQNALTPSTAKANLGRGSARNSGQGSSDANSSRDALRAEGALAAMHDVSDALDAPEAALVWELRAQPLAEAAQGGKAPRGDSLRITQRLISPTPSVVVQSQLLQIPPEGLRQSVAPPAGALSGRGGLRVALAQQIAGGEAGPPGLRQWWQLYPHRCLEQSTARAIGLGDLGAWQQLMQQLPSYLDGDGLAHYFVPGDDRRVGSVTLTAHLLRVDAILKADDPRWALPAAVRDRMLGALARFVAGQSQRDRSGGAADASRVAERLAAMAALAVHGRARVEMLQSLEIEPAAWPTHAVLDWLDILQALPNVPEREAHIAQARAQIAARQSSAGDVLAFDPNLSAAADAQAWLHMQNAHTHQARWLLHTVGDAAFDGERARVLAGLLAAQRGGAWATTAANTWATLALRRFSQHYEREPVTGESIARLADATWTAQWPQTPSKEKADLGRGSSSQRHEAAAAAALAGVLPWPAKARADALATFTLEHKGAGRPWAAIQAVAAVPDASEHSAGYRVEKTVERIATDGSVLAGAAQRGDILRVRLRIHSDAGRNWVALSDPIAAGATILNSGLARDEAIATANDDDNHDGYGSDAPAFIERDHDGLRAYWEHVEAGQTLTLTYYVRLNAEGTFALGPTRVEALYDPAAFGQRPNATLKVGAAQ